VRGEEEEEEVFSAQISQISPVCIQAGGWRLKHELITYFEYFNAVT
jgi:hypothetical protein